MIIVHLDVMLAKRKMSVSQLAKELDMTLANVSILKNNKAKAIRIETLNKLCTILECQPKDLLEFKNDGLV